MAPQSSDASGSRGAVAEVDGDVVISGVAGHFPDTDSVAHFGEQLFNKVELVSSEERRWKKFGTENPRRAGTLNNLNKFDASFFGIDYREAHAMNPASRLLLERCYEALIDAGISPGEMRGARAAVIVAICFTESDRLLFHDKLENNYHGVNGCSRGAMAARISRWLGLTGPAYAADTACSSALSAVQRGYRAIADGECDAAIVAGANLCLNPMLTMQFVRLGVSSQEGRCRCFDERADGYVRSEAVVVCVLQRAKHARRVYAKIVHAKMNCDGYKEQSITYPSGQDQRLLLNAFYKECSVDPSTVEFVEAHGTGTKIGDVEELKAIDEVFSVGRTEPVLIGSVKSNMGHSEAASGMCSLAKACIAYNSGYIPPNLHYETPRQEILGLVAGRLQVVSDKRPWGRGRYAINNFGFGGANAHVLLEKYARTKVNNGLPSDDLPRLVCVSGRTSSAVDKILNDLESKPIDVEVVRLWHAVHATRILNHSHRGYVLLGNGFSKSIPLHRHSRRSGRARRPVWFVYSGMGDQWSRVANHLKALTVFSNSITKSRDALKSKGIDLLDIVYTNKATSVGALASCFVGAVAVQIGLTDVLRSVGVEPDHIVGEGVGQLACAYADGCLTAAQAILCAYCCAVSFNEATTVKGSMAIVSKGIKKIKELCPVELEVVCHDVVSCSAVAGPAAAVQDFVNRLTAQGVAVKQINSADVALHSRYVTNTSATLLKHLEEVITDAKGPTDRWLSTSVPQNLMNNSIFAKASPAYFANSLQSPVLFEEISKLMGGEEAITVQMADQGVLREVLKQSHLDPVNIELSQVDSNDNIQVLLNALGRLYIAGVDLDLANLYPEVEFPVSQETPMISHLVEWEHGENWECDLFKSRGKLTTGERTVSVRIKDESNEFLTGHYIDGRLLYPGSGYLVLVWETLALMREQVFSAMSVVFEDVRFHRFTTIPEQNLEFTINIHELSGEFELSENGSTVVTGRIRAEDNPGEEFVELPPPLEDGGFLRMSAKDFYKELKLRGYQYSGQFRGVVECNVEATRSRVSWNDNWVAFLDNVMQIALLAADTRNLQLPTFIDRLVFDVDLHYAEIAKLNAEEAREKFIDVCYNHDLDIIRCGGVEVCGVQKAQILKKPSTVGPPAVQRYKFIPNFPENAMQLQDVINQHVQLVLENVKSLRIRCVEMVDEEYSKYSYLPVIENIKCALDVQPHVQSHLFIVSDQPVKVSPEIKVEKNKEAVENTLLYVGADLLRRNDELRQCAAMLKNEGFILSRERVLPDSDVDHDCCTIVSACKTGSEVLVLLRPKYEVSIGRCIKIELEDDSYSWMDEVKKCVGAGEKIILYARNDCYSGILGLVNCLKKEIGGNLIQCYVISGESAPEFDPKDSFYKPRINKDLMMNVFQNNQWGSYCHLPILDLDKTAPVAHAYVNVQTVGDLSSLRWVQGSLGSHIPENRDSEILNVMCSALNFRDVMTATGRLQADEVVRGRVNQDCVQGVEVCGRTANGSRVAAMARRGISNMVSLQNALVCAIPDEWSYEEGATVLVAYVTVYYAMIVIGKMKPGESILIHAGTGGVGQAAISLALHHGCEVFTTVGSAAKRALIKRLFPSLKDSHIGNSRDVSFEEMVTRETRGKGVDLVLNSLAEEKLVASVRCLGHRGRFLEIGRYDMSRNTAVELRSRRELAFYPVMLDYIFDDDSYDLRKELELLIVEGIATGAVRPLTACVFGKDEVEAAFRYMAAGRHVGKILIRIQEEESSPAGSALVEAVPRYICREERVYVLVGGLGGFGLELADWLVIRGARKLVIVSSRGVSNGYQASRLRLWRQYGARAEISTHDVSTEAGCEQVLRLANSMGPVDAIFNLAAKFIDFTFAKQTPDCFRTSLKSKAFATIHLDRVSRRLCPSLQKFVVFSSLACGHGNAGQTSYAFANSAMERVCERRRASGLHALAVQWGAVGDVGVVADMTEANRTYEIAGTVTQPIACCLDVLDKLLLRDEVIVSSFVVAEKAEGAADVETIVDTVAQIMGIKNLKSVSQQAALAELGIDSMISTELKQTLERQYGIFLSAHEIRNLTFAKLAEMNMKENATANGAEVLAASDKETTRIAWRSFGEEEMVRKPYVRLSNTHNECNAENVFLIPGIDGCSYNLEWLCRKLNAAVCILQPGLHLNDRLCDMVDRFYMTVKEQITPGRPFLLLGYSFGTVPVLELAAKLEQDGYEGQVCALDGSPVFSKAHLKAHIRTELQHHAVALVMNVVIPKLHDVRFVKEKLQVILSIDEKIDYLIDELKFKVGYSRDFLKSISTCIYERMLQLERLDADAMSRIRSPITLVRTHEVTVCSGARHDYSLGRFTSASVRVRSIVGDHYSILDSDECAAIINEMIKNVPSATTSK